MIEKMIDYDRMHPAVVAVVVAVAPCFAEFYSLRDQSVRLQHSMSSEYRYKYKFDVITVYSTIARRPEYAATMPAYESVGGWMVEGSFKKV